jgi:hypothetical protein
LSAPQTRSKNEWLIQHPERIGDALANVILQDGHRETVLGQAWLAAPGRMVTCGHVVERFAGNPSGLYVKFPSSGNIYPVQIVRLHPSFVRQPDQLVKFDVALLEVNFAPPESAATPLPFTYEQSLHTNQTLWVIRYPTHLAQLSAATQPLTQDGKFLGPLRKHDSFHLLHDLPLAPGDSGAPITDGNTILAVHCGDTATVPGLNLPTTSIRLALWVDALRELGLSETIRPGSSGGSVNLMPAILAFIIMAGCGAFLAYKMAGEEVTQKWKVVQPRVAPVRVSFNEPIHSYKKDQKIQVQLVPGSPSFVYLYQVNAADDVFLLYPQYTQEPRLDKGETRIISTFGTHELIANADRDKLHVVAVDGNSPEGQKLAAKVILESDKAAKGDEAYSKVLRIKGRELLARVRSLKDENPELVIHAEFDSPHSN